ncbi:hypothetical protein R6Q57_012157 [Mikania cordata]
MSFSDEMETPLDDLEIDQFDELMDHPWLQFPQGTVARIRLDRLLRKEMGHQKAIDYDLLTRLCGFHYHLSLAEFASVLGFIVFVLLIEWETVQPCTVSGGVFQHILPPTGEGADLRGVDVTRIARFNGLIDLEPAGMDAFHPVHLNRRTVQGMRIVQPFPRLGLLFSLQKGVIWQPGPNDLHYRDQVHVELKHAYHDGIKLPTPPQPRDYPPPAPPPPPPPSHDDHEILRVPPLARPKGMGRTQGKTVLKFFLVMAIGMACFRYKERYSDDTVFVFLALLSHIRMMSSFPVSSASIFSSPLPSAVIADSNATKHNVTRNTMTFSASIWGDQFLTYDHEPEDMVVEKQVVEHLKEAVKKELMIKASPNDTTRHMKLIELIDAVQRLGIAYHFEDEIEEALQRIYVAYGEKGIDDNSLQNISLWFRILRQQGFNVSSGIFKNYMDEKEDFKESLCDDAQGMLALYEASYMRVKGEKVLDDALEFTKTHLAVIAKDSSCDPLLRTQIQTALKQPLRKRLPRLEALRYIPIYQQQASHNELLLKLAKLDFNVLQSIHKKELSQLCKWWKELDIQKNLPHVRDRMVECYFWALAIYFEPQCSRTRMFLNKTCMWLVVLDDTFDNYGTYEELKIFTEAVQRWSISCMDMLPEYMKVIYEQLLKHHQEMEESLESEGKAYQIHYVKELVKELTENYLIEAKWLKDGYVPTLEEYMSVSMVTGAYGLIVGRSYVGRSDDKVNEDSFKWVATYPPIVKASSKIVRLMDDIASHKEEQERGHVASSVECYRNETGASEKEACEYILKQVEDAWKVINQESLRPTEIPFPLLMPAINLARMADVLYDVGDGFTHAGKEIINHIKSLFLYPAVI